MGLSLSKRRRSSGSRLELSHIRTYVYHRVLRRNFHFIAEHSLALIKEADETRLLAEEFVAFAGILAELLRAFHSVEDEVVFPFYRKHLSIVMDEFLSEHKKLSAFCDAIIKRAHQARARGAVVTDDIRQIRRSSLAISMELGPLFQKKELSVTRDMLLTMPVKQHRNLAAEAHRGMRLLLESRRSVLKGVVFYSLTDEERPLFDSMPDSFKNPVIAAEWKEAMRPFLTFVYNPPDEVPRSKIYEAYLAQERELDRPLVQLITTGSLNEGDKAIVLAESTSDIEAPSASVTEGTTDRSPNGTLTLEKKLKPLSLRGQQLPADEPETPGAMETKAPIKEESWSSDSTDVPATSDKAARGNQSAETSEASTPKRLRQAPSLDRQASEHARAEPRLEANGSSKSLEQSSSNDSSSEKSLSSSENSDSSSAKSLSEKSLSQRSLSEKSLSEKSLSKKSLSEKSLSEKSLSEKSLSESLSESISSSSSSSMSGSGTDSLVETSKVDPLALSHRSAGSLGSSNASAAGSASSSAAESPESFLSPRMQVALKRQAAFEKIEEERRVKEREAWQNQRTEIERERESKKVLLLE